MKIRIFIFCMMVVGVTYGMDQNVDWNSITRQDENIQSSLSKNSGTFMKEQENITFLWSYFISDNVRIFYDGWHKNFFFNEINIQNGLTEEYYRKVFIETNNKQPKITFSNNILNEKNIKLSFYRNDIRQGRKSYAFLEGNYDKDRKFYYYSRDFLFWNWIHGQKYNYDLNIYTFFDCFDAKQRNKAIEYDMKNFQGISISLKQHSQFLNEDITLSKNLKIDLNQNISKGEHFWCKSVVCDGINLFILAENVGAPKERYILHYVFDFEELQNALNHEIELEDNNDLENKAIKFLGKISFEESQSKPLCLGLHINTNTLLVGFDAGDLKIYDYKLTEISLTPSGSILKDPILYMDVDQDNNLLIVGSKDLFTLYRLNFNTHDDVVLDRKSVKAYSELTTWREEKGTENSKPENISVECDEKHKETYDIKNEKCYMIQKNIYTDQDFILTEMEAYGGNKKNYQISKSDNQWGKSDIDYQEMNIISTFKNIEGSACYKEEEVAGNKKFLCVQNKILFFIGGKYDNRKFLQLHLENKQRYQDIIKNYFYIYIRDNDDKDTYNNDFFIRNSECSGQVVINFCTDGKELFLVTDKNEILHYTLSLSRTHGWLSSSITSNIKFKNLYTINEDLLITSIEYYKKGQSIIIGLEDGTLQMVNIDTKKITNIGCKNFGEPIDTIVLNGCEENIVIGSKSKFILYDFKPFASNKGEKKEGQSPVQKKDDKSNEVQPVQINQPQQQPQPSFWKDPVGWIKGRSRRFWAWLGLGTAAAVGTYHVWQKYKQHKE